MSLPLAVVLGVIVGLIGALPGAIVLERVISGKAEPSFALALAAILVPLVLMCASLILVRYFCATMLWSFALPIIFVLIVVWAIEGVRAWLVYRYDAPEERM